MIVNSVSFPKSNIKTVIKKNLQFITFSFLIADKLFELICDSLWDFGALGIVTDDTLDPAFQNIPVIVVSAKTGLKEIEKTFSLGATDFITKPFSTTEYLNRIKLALSK